MYSRDLLSRQRLRFDRAMRRPNLGERASIAPPGVRLELADVALAEGVNQSCDRQGGALAGFLGARILTHPNTRQGVQRRRPSLLGGDFAEPSKR
jgi:hypothetical protein